MKNASFLIHLGLVLLCICGMAGCTGNAQSPQTSDNIAQAVPQSFAEMAPHDSTETNTSSTVYICKSKGAKKYHYKETCRGLNNCKHEVVKIEKKDAENRGLGLCGWED